MDLSKITPPKSIIQKITLIKHVTTISTKYETWRTVLSCVQNDPTF